MSIPTQIRLADVHVHVGQHSNDSPLIEKYKINGDESDIQVGSFFFPKYTRHVFMYPIF